MRRHPSVTLARWAGALFLGVMALGIVAELSTGNALIVPGDALASLANIGEQTGRYRLGFTLYLLEMAGQTALTVLFYRLLRPASATGAALALAFGVVGCVVKTVARAFYLAPLLLLGPSAAASAFAPGQVAELAVWSFELNALAAGIALVFFGLHAIVLGVVLLRSRLVPRLLGAWSVAGGVGWLTFLHPPLGLRALPLVALVGITGGAALAAWLLVRGVADPHGAMPA